LEKQRTKINIAELSWERLNEKRASRAAIYTNGEISDIMSNNKEKDKLIQWATTNMRIFVNEFKNILLNLK
jgi:hypothetical protein